MKKWLVAGGLTAVFLVAGYLTLSRFAVRAVESQLSRVMGPGLTVDRVEVDTTRLSIRGVKYEDPQSKRKMVVIEEVRIYPSLFSFLKGSLHVKEFLFVRPSFFYYRSPDGAVLGPWFPNEKKERERESPIREGKTEKGSSVEIGRIRVVGGSIDFDDRKVEGSPSPLRLRELDLRVEGIRYPVVSSPSPFELKGRMEGRTRSGEVEARGWVNLQTTDMETTLKVHGVEVKTFEPYYRKRVSAEIESGTIDLEASIEVKKRMIEAPGSMELADLRMKEEGTVFWIPAKTLVSLLKDRGNRIRAKFRVRGDLDDPRFDLQESILTRLAFSLGEGLGLPVKTLGEILVGGAGKGSQGLSEGLKSLGDFFKKEKKPQEKPSGP